MSAREAVSTVDEQRIRDMVRRVVLRTVGTVESVTSASKRRPVTARKERRLVTQEDLAGIPAGESFTVPAGSLISPLARQAATERQISLVESPLSPAAAACTGPAAVQASGNTKTVVLGADHGGYELKEMLKDYVRDLGYSVIDCGTDSEESVDYPDFAFAAARLVAQGKAWRAILVDGAGIGSCMAANKVPGVRAAMCYDEATAVNSREHNHANVLTLGAGLIGAQLGRQIVKTWLATAPGGGRHERRVKKIMDIEKRYLRA